MKHLELTDEQRDFLQAFAEQKERITADTIRQKAFIAHEFKDYPEAMAFLSVEFRRAIGYYAKAYKIFRAYFDPSYKVFVESTPDQLLSLITLCQLPSKVAVDVYIKQWRDNAGAQMQYAMQAVVNEHNAKRTHPKRGKSKQYRLSNDEISKIADVAIAEGRTYTDYAWHYIGEDNAHEIICTAISKALERMEQAK